MNNSNSTVAGVLRENDIQKIHEFAYQSLSETVLADVKVITKEFIAILEEWKLLYGYKPYATLYEWLSSKPGVENSQLNPWECAGPEVENPIDLALMLWAEDYEKINNFVNKYGLLDFLSVLLLLVNDPIYSRSIFRAYNLLIKVTLASYQKQFEKQADIEIQKSRRLDIARTIAAEQKRERARLHKEAWDRWAVETKKANPNWSLVDIADYVHMVAIRQGHKMANGKSYKVSTIKKSLQGYWERFEASGNKSN